MLPLTGGKQGNKWPQIALNTDYVYKYRLCVTNMENTTSHRQLPPVTSQSLLLFLSNTISVPSSIMYLQGLIFLQPKEES